MACILDNTGATIPGVWLAAKEVTRARMNPVAAEQERFGNSHDLKLIFVEHIGYYLTMACIKAAYMLFYTGLYFRADCRRKIPLYIAWGIYAASYISGLFLLFFWCHPLSDNWHPTNPYCSSVFSLPIFTTLALLNIITDLAILLPLFTLLSSLRLQPLEKASLAVIMGIGSISIVASMVRLVVVGKRLKEKPQMDWDTARVCFLLCIAEILFAVVAFVGPSFRGVFIGWRKERSRRESKQEVIQEEFCDKRRFRVFEGCGSLSDEKGLRVGTPKSSGGETEDTEFSARI
ncbi:Similar to hypothetical protein [Tuber melanosporum Mel28]; acc. no. XP_002835566 [Pyronema omphalodes CBS 100304]|uniref:Rhodopsin domain-containing protein n=1 Tax=Pyronema omphalodes (strain CBS 100304) TaxID=1076935 RepID=U4LYL8_PYROM|nr:Similar to hypothetical protein [Tuber melanosporum Mel28]; acc. no. XP_002835566 [Pyronema omphalodes CBS 100304]